MHVDLFFAVGERPDVARSEGSAKIAGDVVRAKDFAFPNVLVEVWEKSRALDPSCFPCLLEQRVSLRIALVRERQKERGFSPEDHADDTVSFLAMQRRDPKSFFEEVLAKLPDVDDATKKKLLALVEDKPGTKRAQKISAVIAEKT